MEKGRGASGMSNLVRICLEADLPEEGQACEIVFNRKQFCVARSGGEIAVMDNLCPHNEGPLGQGLVEDGCVVCPWHAWAFDVKTGNAQHNERARVQIYDCKVQDGALMIDLPEF
jgi:nitrite reductase (NADH) small subunit